MIREVIFPKLSNKTDEGVLTGWNKQVGDLIAVGEVLYEIETEKAIHEIEVSFPGTLKTIHKHIGDTVKVDEVVAEIEVQS